jgi:hypothetical protein
VYVRDFISGIGVENMQMLTSGLAFLFVLLTP